MSKKIPTSIRLNNLTPEFDEAIRLKRIELLQQGKDYKKEDIVKEIVLEYRDSTLSKYGLGKNKSKLVEHFSYCDSKPLINQP